MKCNEILFVLETGTFIRRLLARRHANSCARCSAAYERWLAAKAELIQQEPLSQYQRELWIRVATTGTPVTATLHWRPRLVIVCAMLVVIVAGTWILSRELLHAPVPPHVAAIPITPPATSIDPIEEVLALKASVDQLEQELAAIEMRAQQLDARQFATEIIARYRPWSPQEELP